LTGAHPAASPDVYTSARIARPVKGAGEQTKGWCHLRRRRLALLVADLPTRLPLSPPRRLEARRQLLAMQFRPVEPPVDRGERKKLFLSGAGGLVFLPLPAAVPGAHRRLPHW
jgi:hypothetical protein